jgi:hypothetical protein
MIFANVVCAASIGLFADSTCSSCNLTVPLGGSGTMYVSVVTAGLPESGVVAAELRITGLPHGWLVNVAPNAAASDSYGNLFGSGAAIAFPGEGISGSCVLLYRVVLTNYQAASEVTLRAESVDPPRPGFLCPEVSLNCACTNFCVGGGALFVNSSRNCDIATVPETWSRIKRLYQ